MSKNTSYCAVANCNNYGRKTSDVIYHRFPKSAVQKIWTARCKRADEINVNNARICSIHFLPEDYERDLKNELLGLPIKKRLKANAVPSQHLPNWHGDILTAESNSEDADEVLRERAISHENGDVRMRAVGAIESVSPKKQKVDQVTNTVPICELSELRRKDEEINRLNREIEVLKRKNEVLEMILKQRDAALKRITADRHGLLKKRKFSATVKESVVSKKVENVLSKCFTPGQIRCLLKGQNRVKWSSQDIENALTLKALSRKAYAYLRKRNIPLPCRSTLQNWTRNIKCNPGVDRSNAAPNLTTAPIVNFAMQDGQN